MLRHDVKSNAAFHQAGNNMAANLTNAINEAGGSEEFRKILRVLVQHKLVEHKLVQNKQEDGFRVVESSTKPRRKARVWIERVLLVSGFALLAIYGAARLESFFGSRAALKRFEAIEPSSSSASASPEVAEPIAPTGADFSLWDDHRIQAYKQSLIKQSGDPLAVLHISKIGLEVPLLDGTDGLTLNRAVGRIAGTARPGEPGNIGIAGHRDGFFRGLKNLAIGDSIDLKTRQGTASYVVDEIDIVSPNDVKVLAPRPAPSLTLVTCYPFRFIGSAPQRYIVHASLTEFALQKYNPTEQGSLTLAMNNKEKTQ
jgi:sortase A